MSSRSSSDSSSSSSSSSSSGSSSSGDSSSTSSDGPTEKTEKDLPEAKVEGGYDVATSAAAAASVYARPATSDLGKYSMVGPSKKDDAQKMASTIKQLQSAMSSKIGASMVGKKTGRKLFIMRHAERMDRLFPEWLTMGISENGTYMPYDMNMPLMMIDRSAIGGWASYDYDTPITEMGALSGQMVGRGMKSCGVDLKAVYASSSLRCVQTANGVLKTFDEKLDLKINVEPGLFEWLAWYDSMPKFIEPNGLSQSKLRVNEQYRPVMSTTELASKKSETTKVYYERVQSVIRKILDNHPTGSILIVAHGSTIDGGARGLTGKAITEIGRFEMDQMGVNYPYCSVVTLEELSGGKWAIQPAVLPQLTFLGFSNRFNPDYLNRQ